MKKYMKQGICSFLSFVLLFTSIQWSGIGVASQKVYGAQITSAREKEVITEENTKTSTTFRLPDGRKQTVFYGQDVRFEDEEGNLIDYDPSLVKVMDEKSGTGKELSEYQYTNKEGDKKHYLPKKLTQETPVLMENGKHVISFAPVYDEDGEMQQGNQQEGTMSYKEGEDSEPNAFSSIQKLRRMTLEDEEVLNAENEMEEIPVKVSYESEDKEYTFEYQSLDTGVKESIILTEKPESNRFSFVFYAKGMIPKKNALDGGITFLDRETEDIVAALEAPNMNDASGNAYSEAVSYEIEPIKGEEDTYLLTLVLEEDYLVDEERKYPITIDPTVTWKGSTDLGDVYVINGSYKNTNFYDSGVTVMMAGKAQKGVYRTYLRFTDFTAKLKGYYVDSAILTMYETGSSQKGEVIEARRVTATWSRSGLTWANRPGYSTNYGSTTTTGTAHKARTINLTKHARDVASGAISSYGIMLRNADDTDNPTGYGQFYSSRYSNSTYRPRLVVTYYDGPTAPTSVTASPQYIKKTGTSKISWSGATSKSMREIQYRVAAMSSDKSEETSLIKDYTSTGKKTSSGTYTLNAQSLGLADGIYRVSIRGLDNGGIKGSRKSVYLYVDSIVPKISSVSIDAGDGKGMTEDDPSTNMTPSLKWKVSDSYLSKVEYQVGSGAIIKAGTSASGSTIIPSSYFKDSGTYTIKVIVTDKSGNQTTKTLRYYYIDQAVASDYQPKEAIVKKSYGKAVISWKKEASLPGSIYYEVHRGSSENFTPSDATLVQSALKNSWCADTLTGSGSNTYYKVRAVKLAKTGKTIGTSQASIAGKIKQDAKSEYQQFLGRKDYRDTVGISTPNGMGTIDKASGNLTYVADDFNISVGTMGLSLTRTYNSQSDKAGMLGNGWYDTFHKHLYQVGNNIVFQDSDGTYLTFEKSGDSYVSKESKDYTLQLENVKNGGFEEESPNEESDSILAQSGEAQESYQPGHNITVSSEDGEKNIEKETVRKMIPSSCTLTDKYQNVYRFDANGYLTAEEDQNGNYILYEYDDQGRLMTVTTSKNQVLTMKYASSGKLETITLPDGTKMCYTYDGSGNLTKVQHQSEDGRESVSYSYTYDEDGWLTKIHDAKGNGYTIAYVGKKAVTFTKPNGEYQKIDYGSGMTTVSTHKEDGTELSKDSMTYDKSSGKILTSVNTSGIQTTYRYENSSNDLLQTGTETIVSYQTLTGNGQKRSVGFQTNVKVSTSTTYDANENVTKEVDETGQTTMMTYGTGSEANLPKKKVTKNSDGESISNITYTYDENGNLVSEKDSITQTESRYAYDEDEDWDLTDEWLYEEGKEISHEEISSKEADYEVDESQMTIQGDVVESTTTKYDMMGRIIESTDENTGEVTKITYDFMGRVIKTEKELDGKVQTETKSYDANGTMTSETTSTGVTTTYAYDSLNRVTKVSESADGIQMVTDTSYDYEDATIHMMTGTKAYKNLFVKTVKTNGTVTSKTWTDRAGNAVRTFVNGIYTDHVFTDDGKEVATIALGTRTSGEGKVTLSLYDKQGQQTHMIQNPKVDGDSVGTDAFSIVTETTYDANGNEASTIDGNGNRMMYAYDDQNRLTEISQEVDGKTVKSKITYVMGDDGKITTSLTDAKGHINREVINKAGLTESIMDLGDGEESIFTDYEYDGNGNKVKETYGNGSYKTFSYDKKNRLIKTESYEASGIGESIGSRTLMTKYSYDINDQVIEIVDYKVSGTTETAYLYTEYSYDSRGRITAYAQIRQSSQPTSDDIKSHRITYAYDADGNLSKITYPTMMNINGVQGLTYTYNGNGWLVSIQADIRSGSTRTQKTVRTYTYDAYGKVSVIKDYRNVLSDGDKILQKMYSYDQFDRVIKIAYKDLGTGSEMESYAYSYDKNSNIIQKTEINRYPEEEGEQVNQTKAYTYDSLGRLVKTVTTDHADGDSKKTICYTYDDVGNRLSEDDGSEKTTYSYNGLDQIKTATIEKGNIVDTVRQYFYDENGNETKVKDTKSGNTTIKAYDAENRLSQVSIEDKDGIIGVVQQNVYNGEGQRIQKVEGSKTTNYYYQDGVVSYTTDGSGNQISQNLIGLDGNIFGTQRYDRNDVTYYIYNKDIQGSTTSLVKEDGSADATYLYTDFGETTIQGDDGVGNEVCYTGGIYDSTTGLYYLNARYYNPEDGRFLTEDTYRGESNKPYTWHLYAYCANNPINYVDPSGHFIETVLDIASLGYSAAKFLASPSWKAAGYLLWDTGSAVIPFLPGSYVKRGGQITLKVASKVSDLGKGKKMVSIGKYKSFAKVFKNRKKIGIEIHHIIEKRFQKLNLKDGDYPSIPLTKELHRIITNRWQKAIPYERKKPKYKKVTKQRLLKAVEEVYYDMPELKKAAIECVNKYYK